MTFEEFLEEKNLTPENTPVSEQVLMKEAYEAGYKAGSQQGNQRSADNSNTKPRVIRAGRALLTLGGWDD